MFYNLDKDYLLSVYETQLNRVRTTKQELNYGFYYL